MVFILIENEGKTLQLENGMIAYWTVLSVTFKNICFLLIIFDFLSTKDRFFIYSENRGV